MLGPDMAVVRPRLRASSVGGGGWKDRQWERGFSLQVVSDIPASACRRPGNASVCVRLLSKNNLTQVCLRFLPWVDRASFGSAGTLESRLLSFRS